MTSSAISSPPDAIANSETEAAPATAVDRIEAAVSAGPLKFGFRYLDKSFRATVTRDQGRARLMLHGHLGDLPFTAQSAPARAGLLRLMRSKYKGPAGRFELGPNQAVLVHGHCGLELPLSAAGIVAGAVEILIAWRDRIGEIVAHLNEAAAAPASAESSASECSETADPISPES
jgi:hypothetical protein